MAQTTQGKRILLIDDDESIRKPLQRRLEAWGFEVIPAATGEEGLTLAEAQQPDLILLDVVLPKMKGREVCGALKSNPSTRRIPVIFLTALGLADHIKAGMDLGAEDYIVKPIEPEQLRMRLEVCLLRHADRPDA
ncbi:MAG TPA: response regulator [bacterium]